MSQAPAAGVSDDDGAPQVTSVLVVGYSSAPEGRAALSRAIGEARIRNSKLIVVHASRTRRLPVSGGARRHWHSAHDPGASRAMEPAEELINAAETGRGGLHHHWPTTPVARGEALLGSNAQRVLLDASCPVLAVKADPNA